MTPKEATVLVGGLSVTSKMPCKSYNTSAYACVTGSKLRKVPGSVCADCYACKGHYRFNNVQRALDRRLKSITHPKWCDAMVKLITGMPFFRWHDSGDIQSVAHLSKIVEVCYRTPRTKHWLPTREYQMVLMFKKKGGKYPKNLCVRLSALMVDGNLPIELANQLGVQMSGVSKIIGLIPEGCPAHEQENQCKSCRRCWDTNVPLVVYKWH